MRDSDPIHAGGCPLYSNIAYRVQRTENGLDTGTTSQELRLLAACDVGCRSNPLRKSSGSRTLAVHVPLSLDSLWHLHLDL